MIRWQYVAPRLAAVAIVLLVCLLGMNPFAQWLIVRSSEQVVGARVNIDRTRVKLFSGSIELNGLAVADPKNDMRNLVNANQVWVNLNMAELFHRNIVVEDVVLDGVRFREPRLSSGRLPTKADGEQSESIINGTTLVSQAAELIPREWLRGLSKKALEDTKNSLVTVRVGRELEEEWSNRIAALIQSGEGIKIQVNQIDETIKSIENPLRDWQQMESALKTFEKTRADLVQLKTTAKEIPVLLATDRQRLIDAKNQDWDQVKEMIPIDLNGIDTGIADVLYQKAKQQADEYMQYVRTTREILDWTVIAPKDNRTRGVDVAFPRRQDSPSLWFQNVRFRGELDVKDSKHDIRGTLTNLSSSPAKLSEPTKAAFQISGNKINATVQSVRARQKSGYYDEVTIDCPSIPSGGFDIGDSGDLRVKWSGNPISMQASFRLTEDTVVGKIVLAQTNSQISIASQSVEEIASLIDSVNGNLSGIREVRLAVDVTGAIQSPDFKMNCDLPEQLAAGFRDALASEWKKQQLAIQQKIEAELSEQTSRLETLVSSQRSQIDNQLERADDMVDSLAKKFTTRSDKFSDTILSKLPGLKAR